MERSTDLAISRRIAGYDGRAIGYAESFTGEVTA